MSGPMPPRPEGRDASAAQPRRARSRSPIDRGICEFGGRMSELLEQLPHARGAVLTDGFGEPIDSARRTEQITEIDIQIAGAQLGQCMARVKMNATIFGLGRATVIAETEGGMLIARPLLDEYLFTVVMRGAVSLSRALFAFEACAADLEALMA